MGGNIARMRLFVRGLSLPLPYILHITTMSKIEKNLMAGEGIVYEAQLHWSCYWLTGVLYVLAVAVWAVLLVEDWRVDWRWPAGACVVFILWGLLNRWWVSQGKRFVLTNYRLIEQRGILRRVSLELLLHKIESVRVEQSFWGRIFGCGKVVVSTGEDNNIYPGISHPARFSTMINQQVIARQREATVAPAAAAPPSPVAPAAG